MICELEPAIRSNVHTKGQNNEIATAIALAVFPRYFDIESSGTQKAPANLFTYIVFCLSSLENPSSSYCLPSIIPSIKDIRFTDNATPLRSLVKPFARIFLLGGRIFENCLIPELIWHLTKVATILNKLYCLTLVSNLGVSTTPCHRHPVLINIANLANQVMVIRRLSVELVFTGNKGFCRHLGSLLDMLGFLRLPLQDRLFNQRKFLTQLVQPCSMVLHASVPNLSLTQYLL